ncbi:MAG: hypothetical protein IJ880_06485 [Bacilli bacterium]|nr:hypothetical protein [Bacilli bacterium]
MLSTPEYGWTTFNLGENEYSLSYLTDVANEWLGQAIHGLETLEPFSVHGFLEGWRMICTVSYWNTHIFVEDDENVVLDKTEANYEIVHIRMIDFCKQLYDDISRDIDKWADWFMDEDDDLEENKRVINEKLEKLKILIDDKEDNFASNRFFC